MKIEFLKKYINKVLLGASLLSFNSCHNLLVEEPKSSVNIDQQSIENLEDLEIIIYGIYNGFTVSKENPNGNWKVLYPVYGWGSMGTDIWTIASNNVGIQSKFSRYVLTSADNQLASNWIDLYKTIERANIAIELTEKVPNVAENQVPYQNSLIAEARFLRAFAYMDLVQFYGGVPIKTIPTKVVNEETLAIPRATEAEVWALIIEDLEYASEHLFEASIEGRANKWSAKGMLSKAYLTRGGYPVGNYSEPEWFEKAAKVAYEVISQSGKTLVPTTDGASEAYYQFGQQFLHPGENGQESLFEIQFQEGGFGSGWGARSVSAGLNWYETTDGRYYAGWGGSLVGSDFALSFNDKDIRFQWSLAPFSGKSGKPTAMKSWTPSKFRWETLPPGLWDSSSNARVLRLADVYLIFAEASNEATGNPSANTYGMSAFDAINEVRKRAQVPLMDEAFLQEDSPFTSEDLLYDMSFQSFDKTDANYSGRHVYYKGDLKERFRDAVLMERAWELCFERHRWFDLKRTGHLIDYTSNTNLLSNGILLDVTAPIDKSEFKANKGPSYSTDKYTSSNIQEHNKYLPIPDIEIKNNSAINIADQNPGY